MATSVDKNGGFSLLEVLFSLGILLVVMAGLFQAMQIAMEYNLKNHLRDEAVLIGEKHMNIQRGLAFSALTTLPTINERSKLRGGNLQYRVDISAPTLSSNATTPAKQVNIVVSWTYKGTTYQNRVSSTVSVAR